MSNPNAALDFAFDTTFDDLPADVVAFTRRCLLDIVGVAAAGSTTELARTITDHAARFFAAGASPGDPSAAMLFDGRRVSPVGAALAGGMTIDSIDAHDGHRLTKGHSGCTIVPATFAFADATASAAPERRLDGRELLTILAIGYEVVTRAGIALHTTVPDYHTSGAWGAVGCAMVGARMLGLDRPTAREAIGIAEYHGPRSQMMRVIDHPTMLKDGSGWGAMAGVSATYLAAAGFTGAPAITVEADEVAELWSDLGSNWRIFEQYFKPHPVCRWAQPAVEAALKLCRTHSLASTDIARVEISTFHEARRLDTPLPTTTEQAQYSLPFPTAAAIVRGQLGVEEVTGDAFDDPEIRRLSTATSVTESDPFNAEFPARRFAQVSLVRTDGSVVVSEPTEARGDPDAHLATDEIVTKYHALSTAVIDERRSKEIQSVIESLGTADEPPDAMATLQQLITDASDKL